MKYLYCTLFGAITSIAFPQATVTVLIDNSKTVLIQQDAKGAAGYDLMLAIPGKKGADIDYYNFRIILDSRKSFEENGIIVPKPDYITLQEIKEMSACEVHDLFSSKTAVFIRKDAYSDTYRRWLGFYTGTVRNVTTIKHTGKI
jgi:hypothetical protein